MATVFSCCVPGLLRRGPQYRLKGALAQLATGLGSTRRPRFVSEALVYDAEAGDAVVAEINTRDSDVRGASPSDSTKTFPTPMLGRTRRGPPLRRLLVSSRYVVVAGVLGSLLSAAVALLYGAAAVVGVVVEVAAAHDVSLISSKHLAIELIQLTDLFLLGVVLYIVGMGLYELFIDPALPTPAWLSTHTLDDLKQRLLGVIIVLLSVTFLSDVVEWDGSTSVLALGAAVGLVLLPLVLLTRDHAPAGGGTQAAVISTGPGPDRSSPAAPDQDVALH
jgi:uncharacterized membrane protein YqhA